MRNPQPASSPVEAAKQWWAAHVNVRPVWRVGDLPDAHFKAILTSLQMAYEIRRDVIALGKPGTPIEELTYSFFWEIVQAVLKPYEPYVLSGLAGMQLLLDNASIPSEIHVLNGSSNTTIGLGGISKLALVKNSNFFEGGKHERFSRPIPIGKRAQLRVETPEALLLRIKLSILKEHPLIVSSFLKALNFDRELMVEVALEQNRPVLFSRIAGLLESFGRTSEAEILRTLVKSGTEYNLPGKRQQQAVFQFPRALVTARNLSEPPSLTAFRDQLRLYADVIATEFHEHRLFPLTLEKLLAHAQKTKKHDTYHSSTIEGYRVSEEEIQSLMDGVAVLTTGESREEIARKMALKGYLEAHKYVLDQLAENFNDKPFFSETLIRETYARLFSPAAAASLLSPEEFLKYRNIPVYIRHSRHVPPNHEKVSDMMRVLVEETNRISEPIVRALIAHYGFVTVHPYHDGNGRIGRFLMNYLFGLAGIPWVTITVDRRDEFFRSLETAQCDGDIRPFTRFIGSYLSAEDSPK